MKMAPKFMALMGLQFIITATATIQTTGIISNINDINQHVAASLTIDDSHDAAGSIFSVENYGAIGDGKHNSTEAFVRAWNAACTKSSATLLVPLGKKFLITNLILKGPCKPGFIFKVDGIIAALQNPKGEKNTDKLLQFDKLESFTLTGKGIINEKEEKWWTEQSTWVNEQRKQMKRGLLPTAYGCKGSGAKHH